RQRLLDLLDEETLPADLRERHVEDLVALRLHDLQAHGAAERLELRLGVLRLPERQRAAAGPDDERCHFLSSPFRSNSFSTAAAGASASSPLSAIIGPCRSLATMESASWRTTFSEPSARGPSAASVFCTSAWATLWKRSRRPLIVGTTPWLRCHDRNCR